MGKYKKEPIDSLEQAAPHSVGRKVPSREIKHRRSFATAELSDEQVQAIGSTRMDDRHAHLDAVLKLK
jgi:hypothetical protein